MYKYKLINNDDFKIAYKKHIRKNLLRGCLLLISIVNIFIFIISYIFFIAPIKTNFILFSFIYSLILLLESSIFFILYKKESKKLINNISNYEANITFDEIGIYIEDNIGSKHIKWKAVNEVVTSENTLSFFYKLTGMPSNFFYLKFFDVESEELIEEIKKYITVRRC